MMIPERERGAALLTVLLLVAVIAVLAGTALERLRLSTRLAANAGITAQLRAFAQATETVALTRIGSLLSAQPERVTLAGGWSGRPFGLPLPGGGRSVARVRDGSNCFNLNGLVAEVGDGTGVYAGVPQPRTRFVRLMQLLGVPGRDAEQVAGGVVDWIDTDQEQSPAGAEDSSYLGGVPSYRTAGTLMADISELRAVHGVTPEIYALLKPWICTMPIAAPVRINVNTLTPEQAPLVAMLGTDALSIDAARAMISRRPLQGFADTGDFWHAAPEGAAGDGQNQTAVTSGWFALDIDVVQGAAELHEKAMVDARRLPARLVSRQWGEPS